MLPRRTRKGRNPSSRSLLFKAIAVFAVAIIVYSGSTNDPLDYGIGDNVFAMESSTAKANIDYHVDETCTKLPTIRPSGSYFLDGKIKAGHSPEGITPSFAVGSTIKGVSNHMNGDKKNFDFIKEALQGREGELAIDFGANQGFYTYYLAALGMQVHSFEINVDNFKSLQHGAEFNSKEVSDRVHLYPVGIGAKNARFGMQGNLYEGFLSESTGPILGATFDCFAHHTKDTIDLSKGVAFVKLDVEGHEIAVLQGAKNSLFRQGSKIGAMVMEVGPNRWGRAGVDIATGIVEMKDLSRHFGNSYLLVRSPGVSYWKTCPVSLAENLNLKPSATGDKEMFDIGIGDWEPLMKTMNEKGFDCNLFFRNA